MDIFSVLNMVGGLALFLYGMSNMGDGLSKMAGSKLEGVLEKLTSKRIFAVLLGAGVTAVIQSSSATTVMVVGFVNSGIMNLSQAVGIIMGANVGTTVTSWLLSLTAIDGSALWVKLLKPSSFSPVLAIIGIFLVMMNKNESRHKDVGSIMLGFAVLMFGMETMSDSVAGLAGNEAFTGLMTAFSNPFLGMAMGALLTAIIQSSSASVGILQALCATGAVNYSIALPIIMGQNIGTCVTSIISSIGASKNARRAAMIHLYFNLIGTAVFMSLFYIADGIMDFAFMENGANAAGIAVIHSLFNISATLFLYPMAGKLVRLAEITVPERKAAEEEAYLAQKKVLIDERFLERPAFAVEICRQKAREMADKTREAIALAIGSMFSFSQGDAEKVVLLENVVDEYEDALGDYLVKLSDKNLSVRDNRHLTQILHSIGDFERISDHAINIVEVATEMHEKGYSFSADAEAEMAVLCRAVNDIVGNTSDVFKDTDIEGAQRIEPLEQVIDRLTKKIKARHVDRLKFGDCSVEMGLLFEDVLINLERVSDHCSNIALELLMMDGNSFEAHEFLDEMSEDKRRSFREQYNLFKKKYALSEENVRI